MLKKVISLFIATALLMPLECYASPAAKEDDTSVPTVYEAALALLDGEYGDMEESKEVLEEMGLDYWLVRHMANALSQGYDKVAQDVIDGKYGNQSSRFRALILAGYDARLVQQIVNGMVLLENKTQ